MVQLVFTFQEALINLLKNKKIVAKTAAAINPALPTMMITMRARTVPKVARHPALKTTTLKIFLLIGYPELIQIMVLQTQQPQHPLTKDKILKQGNAVKEENTRIYGRHPRVQCQNFDLI